MPFEPQRTHEIDWVFSTKRGAAYATLVADVDLTQRIKLLGTDIGQLTRTQLSDAQRMGKGSEFASTVRELTRDMRLARTCDLSSLMAGWAAAFGMGNVATIQPNAGANPTVYRHTIKFSDPSVSKQVPVTTLFEKLSGQTPFLRKLESLAVSDFSISGRTREVAQLAINLVGSGKITTGSVTVPALSSLGLLDMGGMLFKFGPQAAAVDMSERLENFSVSIGQGLDEQNAYHPGSGLYRKRMWMGTRRAAFQFSAWVDVASTDVYDLFLAQTIREVSFKFVGDVITAGQPETHDCEIKFPACKFNAVQIGEQDGKLLYQVSCGEDDVYKGAGGTPDEPVQIVVTNTTATYLAT